MNEYSSDIELKNCSFVKCILMLLVVLGHSLHFWTEDWFTLVSPVYPSSLLAGCSNFISSFHIYCFTLVSGYLFYYLRFERYYGGYDSYWSFIWKKIKRLIIPYCFIAIVWVAPIESILNHYSIKDIIVNFFLGTSPNQLWFLLMLFDLFAIYWFIAGFCKKHFFCGAVVMVVAYIVSAMHVIPNWFQISRALSFLLFFWIGCIFRQYKVLKNKFVRILAAVLYFILYAINEMILKSIVTNIIVSEIVSFIIHILGAVTAFVVLQWVGGRIDWISNSVFKLFSERSMTIYFFHQQIIYFSILMFNGVLNPCVNSLLNMIISIVVSLLISIPLFRFKSTRFLIGEK